MRVTKKQLLANLNKDIEWEYSATLQYVQHASVITGAKYDALKKEMLIHAQEELQHAVALSEQVDYLGGTPTVKVEKRLTSKNNKTMLMQDLDGERQAIRSYKERIGQAEALKEYGLRRALEDILIQEEEHERDISSALEEG